MFMSFSWIHHPRSALITPQKRRTWPISTDEPSELAHYTALYDSLRPPLDAVREHAESSAELSEYELSRGNKKHQIARVLKRL
jgi:ribosomal RNA-processing protein 7